jgi:hypothetical protein
VILTNVSLMKLYITSFSNFLVRNRDPDKMRCYVTGICVILLYVSNDVVGVIPGNDSEQTILYNEKVRIKSKNQSSISQPSGVFELFSFSKDLHDEVPETDTNQDRQATSNSEEVFSISNILQGTAGSKHNISDVHTKFLELLTPRIRRLTSCVKSEAKLRSAVAAAPNGKRNVITLCAEKIRISNKRDSVSGLTGIDISDKVIDLRCRVSSKKRCVLDGANRSRIFFGENARLSAVGIDFLRGSTSGDCDDCIQDGGALYFTDKSHISLDKTSFMSNKANNYGGSIFMRNSFLEIKGGNSPSDGSVFSDNVAAKGGAIIIQHSTITATTGSIIFKNNKAEISGAVDILESVATFKNTHFYKNEAEYVSSLAVSCYGCPVFFQNLSNSNIQYGAMGVSEGQIKLENVEFTNNTLHSVSSYISH